MIPQNRCRFIGLPEGLGKAISISDELHKLEALLERGTLSREEFQQAKAKVLAESAGAGANNQLDEIRAQNQVAQLDREWELERENYMITGRYGNRHIASQAGSFFGGLFIVAFGIFWTIMAAGMGAPFFFPLFGVAFVLFGAATSINGFVKAGQYQAAQARYYQRRQELLGQSERT